LVDNLIFLDDSVQLSKDLINSLSKSKSKIFSFEKNIHEKLNEYKILNYIADEDIKSNERKKLFDKTVEFYNWYEEKEISSQFDFQGINILSVLNPFEFHLMVLPNLIRFYMIKNIIKKENPKNIQLTKKLSIYFTEDNRSKINIETIKTNEKLSHADIITIKINLGKIPISLTFSRKRYSTLKNCFENAICNIFDLWYQPNKNKKSILLLEFNTSDFTDLLDYFSKNKKNVILLNWRRPAIWNLKSIKTLKKSNAKILNYKNFLNDLEKKSFEEYVKKYKNNLKKLSQNEQIFKKIFQIEGESFFSCIKEKLISTYENRIEDYLFFLQISNKLMSSDLISNILTLNEVGETERAILQSNNNRIPVFLLKHDFSNYSPKLSEILWRYEGIRLVQMKSNNFLIWGKTNLEYYLENDLLKDKRIIISGSPRYDSFFNSKIQYKKDKIILITPEPITKFSGLADIKLETRYEMILKTILKTIKNISEHKIIVKLHPGDDEHNFVIKKIINKIDNSITIYHVKSTHELLQNCDVMINITGEIFDPSTIMLEGMILRKPVMEICLDDANENFEYDEISPILSLSYKADTNLYLQKILFDKEFKTKLIENADKELKKFVSFQGNASKKVVEIINSLDKNIK